MPTNRFTWTRARRALAGHGQRLYRRLVRSRQGGSWPAAADTAAVVPFGYDLAAEAPPAGALAVVCHLFYDDLAPDLRGLLANIPFPADLYISTDTEEKRAGILQTFADWPSGRVEVRLSPNRGRDIAPKFVTFADIYAHHELVLFLHGKKTVPYSGGDAWRTVLYESLVGSPEIVRSIVALFNRYPAIGVVAPAHHVPVRPFIHWDENFPYARPLARRMGVALTRRHPVDFAAGSMFWARTAALRPLLELGLGFDDFPPERGQMGRTIQHAIERLIFVAAEHAGFRWIKIAAPALFPADDPLVPITGPAALDRFVADSHRRILPAPRRR